MIPGEESEEMRLQKAYSDGAARGRQRVPRKDGRAGAAPARDSSWRGAWFALAGSLLLHTCAVLWVWHSWTSFGRSGVLAWIDFPVSLAYLRLRGGAKLAWSLAVGGLQWGLVGAALSLLIGTSARRPARPGER
jgi:hypothetical protein